MTTDEMTAWCTRLITGPGGLNTYEDREVVAWNVPERVEAVVWTIRCLANIDCEGAGKVLDAIIERRKRRAELRANYLAATVPGGGAVAG